MSRSTLLGCGSSPCLAIPKDVLRDVPCKPISRFSSLRGAHAPAPFSSRPERPKRRLTCQSVKAEEQQAAVECKTQAATHQQLPLSEQLIGLSHQIETPLGQVVIRYVAADDTMGACLVLTRAFAGTPEEISLLDARKYVDSVVSSPTCGVLFVARIYPHADGDSSWLPANQNSKLIGTVALSLKEDTLQQIPTLPPPPNVAYLSNMAVDVKFRRLGVAKALMHLCDQATKISGLQDIYLHVRQGDEPAFKLYSGAGYQEVARDTFLTARLKNVRPRILMTKRA